VLKWSVVQARITRSSSEDEIANVNFPYDDIAHVLQNTIDSLINSATGRRSSSQDTGLSHCLLYRENTMKDGSRNVRWRHYVF